MDGRRTKKICAKCRAEMHFEKMESKRILLLFFFMRPMSLMLDAISSLACVSLFAVLFLIRHPETSSPRRTCGEVAECLATSNIFFFLSFRSPSDFASRWVNKMKWNTRLAIFSIYLFPRKRKIWRCILMIPLCVYASRNPNEWRCGNPNSSLINYPRLR